VSMLVYIDSPSQVNSKTRVGSKVSHSSPSFSSNELDRHAGSF
jgi:hypothetical protein